jgi:hypothetical protein
MSTISLIVALLLIAGMAAPLALLLPNFNHVTGLLLVCVIGLVCTALHAIWSGQHDSSGGDRVYRILGCAMIIAGATIAISDTPASLGACYLGAGAAILSGLGKMRRKRPA